MKMKAALLAMLAALQTTVAFADAPSPPPVEAPGRPPLPSSLGAPRAATFVDGSKVPKHDELCARVLSLSLAVEQVRAGLPHDRQALDLLAEHIERMVDLLAGAEEHDADRAALDRAVAVGVDLAVYALDLLVAESRPGLGAFRHERLEYALSWCWEGLRALREDPFWVDRKAQEAQRAHLQAWHFHDQNLAGEERSVWGQAGVQAALIVSGGMNLAELAGALPRAYLLAQAGLGRLGQLLARWLPEDGGTVGGVLLPTGSGAISMNVWVYGGARAATLAETVALTETEILALAKLGRLPPTALQLHLAMRADGLDGGTPAQRARAQGLSGTSSVGGQTPPGFRSSQRWDTTRNAEVLKKNLADRGLKCGPGEEVHHIVPSTHGDAEDARRLFDRYGIDINVADNGVILKKVQHHGRGLHSDRVIRMLFARLQRAGEARGRQGILDLLHALAEEIKAGQFPP